MAAETVVGDISGQAASGRRKVDVHLERMRFLSWGIGSISDGEDFSETVMREFASLSRDHRITGRVLNRIYRDRPSWATADLVRELESDQAVNRAVINQQSRGLAALQRDIVPPGIPIMLLKGLCAYAHTRDDSVLRRTLDIDLILKDPSDAIGRMKEAGLEEYRNVSPHELVNVRLEGTELDFHAFYPIWSFQGHVGRSVADSAGFTTIRLHAGSLRVQELSFDDLFEGAFLTDIYEVDNIYFPDAAAATLISCAHGFRDFVSKSSVTARAKPPVRFAEIAEISEFVASAAFNEDRFVRLAKKLDAVDAVEWMGDLVNRHAGRSRLQSIARLLRGGEAARTYIGTPQAIWTGFWETVRRPVHDVTTRHMTTAETAARLGESRVEIIDGSAQINYSDLQSFTGLGSPSTVHMRAEGGMPLALSIRRAGGGLELTMDGSVANPNAGRRVHIDVDGQAFEWQSKQGRTFWKKSDDFVVPMVTASVGDQEFRLEVSIPEVGWERRGDSQILKIIIGVGEFGEGHDIQRGTLFALELVDRG